MAEKVNLELSDLVRMATYLIPSLYIPDFLFKEILECENQSFKTDVDPKILREFIKEICDRLNSNHAMFEHLKLSFSKMHKKFFPYTEKTFLVL